MIIDSSLEERVDFDFESFLRNSNSNQILANRYNKLMFDYYSPVCTFTTENLDSYLSAIEVKDKRCLTVTSSGDQLINLALLGAKEVECFDTNFVSVYFTKLKLAALQALSYEDFIAYFTSTTAESPNGNMLFFINENCFKYEIYYMIRKYLEYDVRLFFDKVYTYYGLNGKAVKESGLFYNFPDDRAIFNNTYLKNKENYYEARKKVKKLVEDGILFYTFDMFDLSHLKRKYDLILLSNIFEHIGDKKEKFNFFVSNELTTILSDDGEVIINYQYGYRQRKNHSCINNLAVYVSDNDNRYYNITDINELQNKGYILIGVPSIYRSQREEGVEDCAYLYRRR